jgi:hypothetical protein
MLDVAPSPQVLMSAVFQNPSRHYRHVQELPHTTKLYAIVSARRRFWEYVNMAVER